MALNWLNFIDTYQIDINTAILHLNSSNRSTPIWSADQIIVLSSLNDQNLLGNDWDIDRKRIQSKHTKSDPARQAAALNSFGQQRTFYLVGKISGAQKYWVGQCLLAEGNLVVQWSASYGAGWSQVTSLLNIECTENISWSVSCWATVSKSSKIRFQWHSLAEILYFAK